MMHLNLCNCATCPILTSCKQRKVLGFGYDFETIYNITKMIGCQLHPKAKEVMMKDAIEELERQAKTCGSTEQQYAFRDAIKIIKGDEL